MVSEIMEIICSHVIDSGNWGNLAFLPLVTSILT